MKKTKVFVILACITCIFYTSCEKSGYLVNKNEISDVTRLLPRTVEGCEDCPVDYCCCSLELWDDTPEADLTVCGFSNGASMCGTFDPPGNCANFSGVGENILLEAPPGKPGVIVCKGKNGVFRIQNNTDDEIVLRMTCQADVTVPVFTIITIPDDGVVYYSTNGSCLLSECE